MLRKIYYVAIRATTKGGQSIAKQFKIEVGCFKQVTSLFS
jgi:hypothetical protein